MIRHQLILHVGPHKTGTTALQEFFSASRGLLESHSLHYPNAGRIYGGHHNLAWEILLDARFSAKEGGWTNLLGELAGLPDRRTVIISSEDFSLIPVAQLGQVFQALAGLDITVLCVYRPLRGFVESFHAEEVKNGKTCLSLDDFAADRIAFDQRIRMDAYLSMMVDFFGVKVRVIPYQDNVVSRVAALLGLPPVPRATGIRANERIALEQLRCILAHRCRHSDLSWHSYFYRYVAPYLAGNARIGDEMAPAESFVLADDIARKLAVQDEQNIRFFRTHGEIEYIED
jgi:hypothetical protein